LEYYCNDLFLKHPVFHDENEKGFSGIRKSKMSSGEASGMKVICNNCREGCNLAAGLEWRL
jgi:hypothetical protein